MDAPTESRRLYQLDSLRGIAALCVVLNHLALLWMDEALGRMSASFRGFVAMLLQPISAGHEAVILFFILSGLVLSIPAQQGDAQPYPAFLVRRIFRIYFPYLIAIMLAVLGNWFFFGSVTDSAWFHQFWMTPVHRADVLRHIVMLGSFNAAQFDPSIWSLVHEMRISLIFPVLCWMALAIQPTRLLLLSFIVSLAYIFYGTRFPAYSSYLSSLHYIAFFVAGICIYHHRERIRERFTQLSGDLKSLILCFALLIYAYPGELFAAAHGLGRRIDLQAAGDWFTAVGASLFIVFAMNSDRVGRLLLNGPTRWLGKVSYSLYLTHFIVLLVLVHAFYGKVNILLLLFICLVTSLAVAQAFYVAVERPSMNLGRRLSKWGGRAPAESLPRKTETSVPVA
jgi:peptidoglycan/LPS O-acetylase OafA/YrhL